MLETGYEMFDEEVEFGDESNDPLISNQNEDHLNIIEHDAHVHDAHMSQTNMLIGKNNVGRQQVMKNDKSNTAGKDE